MECKQDYYFPFLCMLNQRYFNIDEALTTGDSYFVEKARTKILDLCNLVTIIMVSHNLSQISELCKRTILLEMEGLCRR